FTAPGKGALPLNWMDALPQRFTAPSKGITAPGKGVLEGDFLFFYIQFGKKNQQQNNDSSFYFKRTSKKSEKKLRLKNQLAKHLSLSVNSTSKKEVWIYYHKGASEKSQRKG
ncbi:4824_t:CDS:2, partial [Ambispora gerdemannii]